MSELSNEYIENAFAKIRADFEERNNITGLEILDSYEEKWSAYGSLTDRQIDWIEKQLDGSWWSKENRSAISVGSNSLRTKPKFTEARDETAASDPDELLDAMIQLKLQDEGKAIVDLEQLDALAATVDALRDVVRPYAATTADDARRRALLL